MQIALITLLFLT